MTGGRVRLQGASAGDSGFVARHGFPQGCPLPSPLLLLCTQPILCLLQETVPGCLCIRAFADDIAVVFDDVFRIGSLQGPFKAWEKATRLGLNLKKTKIVPLNANPGHAQPDPARLVREALGGFPLPWSTMRVAMAVRYLGVEFGPHSGDAVCMANGDDKLGRQSEQDSRGPGPPNGGTSCVHTASASMHRLYRTDHYSAGPNGDHRADSAALSFLNPDGTSRRTLRRCCSCGARQTNTSQMYSMHRRRHTSKSDCSTRWSLRSIHPLCCNY